MELYFSWLAYSLGTSLAVLMFLAIGYILGGTIGVYCVSAILLIGELGHTIRSPSDPPPSDEPLVYGLAIPVFLMIPGLLIRYVIANRNFSLLVSAGISGSLWFISIHALSSNPQATSYSALLAGMTFSICYSGFSHPFRRAKPEKAKLVSHKPVDHKLFTVNFTDGNPSGWVDKQQVLEWYADGKIDSSSWVYPSDTREWQRLMKVFTRALLEEPDSNVPQPEAKGPPTDLRSPAAAAGKIPPPPADAPTRPSQEIHPLTGKLQHLASSELMATLETGSLSPKAEEEVTAELERRGITFE